MNHQLESYQSAKLSFSIYEDRYQVQASVMLNNIIIVKKQIPLSSLFPDLQVDIRTHNIAIDYHELPLEISKYIPLWKIKQIEERKHKNNGEIVKKDIIVLKREWPEKDTPIEEEIQEIIFYMKF